MDFGVVPNFASEPAHRPAPSEPHETYVALSLLTSDKVVAAVAKRLFYLMPGEGSFSELGGAKRQRWLDAASRLLQAIKEEMSDGGS
jgi:hypothetical protein